MAMATPGSIERLIFTSFLLLVGVLGPSGFSVIGTARCLHSLWLSDTSREAFGPKSSGTTRCPANERCGFYPGRSSEGI